MPQYISKFKKVQYFYTNPFREIIFKKDSGDVDTNTTSFLINFNTKIDRLRMLISLETSNFPILSKNPRDLQKITSLYENWASYLHSLLFFQRKNYFKKLGYN